MKFVYSLFFLLILRESISDALLIPQNVNKLDILGYFRIIPESNDMSSKNYSLETVLEDSPYKKDCNNTMCTYQTINMDGEKEESEPVE